MRLSPMIQVEEILIRKLTLAGSAEHIVNDLSDGQQSARGKEVAVNSNTPWKGVFGRLKQETRDSIESDLLIDWDDPQDPGVVLHACADDMKRLWNDPTIQKLLDVQKMRLEEVAGL